MTIKELQEQINLLEKELGKEITRKSQQSFTKKFMHAEGVISQLFKELPKLPQERRKPIGIALNKLKKEANTKYQAFLAAIAKTTPAQEKKELLDATLPPAKVPLGGLHPLTLIQERAISILEKIGFTLVEGPEIEDEWHNFTALNFPEDHPARDMQDTFFIDQPNEAPKKQMGLRSQTSSVQIRTLESYAPPLRIIATGRVFRNETISSRSHCMFHQLEALYVDKQVCFSDLKETIRYFVQALFGEHITSRLRPSYFPFTTPSAEIDIACLICKGEGCAVCKRSGWVEIGGSGMVDPQVLENCDLSAETYSGFAFGLGIERIAMLLAEIPDVRLFTENDLRFLRQFRQSTITA